MERIRLVLYADNAIGELMYNDDIQVPDTAEAALQRVIAAIAEFQINSHPLGLPSGNVISVIPDIVTPPGTEERYIALVIGTYSGKQAAVSGYTTAYFAALSVSSD